MTRNLNLARHVKALVHTIDRRWPHTRAGGVCASVGGYVYFRCDDMVSAVACTPSGGIVEMCDVELNPDEMPRARRKRHYDSWPHYRRDILDLLDSIYIEHGYRRAR
jgi:hypothetical protein